MSQSPRLKLSYILPSQAQKHVSANESFRRLDALVQLSVKAAGLAAEPAAPSEGDAYILPAGAAGASWSAMAAGAVAAFQDGQWLELSPRAGWRAFVEDAGAFRVHDGAGWNAEAMSGGPATFAEIGVNAAADETNKLAVKSDAALFTHDDATPGTGDARVVVNKSAAAKTASVVFQDGFSGRAEFGLTGSDDFSVKVSPDGAAWLEAVFVDKDTGFVGVGSNAPASRLHVKQASDARLTMDTETAAQGGGFDIINSGDGANWRVTGQSTLFKIRDHAALLDKLTLEAGSSGHAYFMNFANLGVGTAAPSARLHVEGAVRVKSYTVATLPSASGNGAGAILYVSNEAGGATLVFSDGTNWRRASDRAVVS